MLDTAGLLGGESSNPVKLVIQLLRRSVSYEQDERFWRFSSYIVLSMILCVKYRFNIFVAKASLLLEPYIDLISLVHFVICPEF